MSKPRQGVRQTLPEEPYQWTNSEPVYYNTADNAAPHQSSMEQQGAYDNDSYENTEQATLYAYGYNAGYLDGYKAAYRQYRPYRSRSYVDYPDSGGKSTSTSTKEFRIANKARLIALIVLCGVITAALLLLLASQLFLSGQDHSSGYRAGGDRPFPPLAIPKKTPANDSTGCQGQATGSPRLREPVVPEERLRMRVPMNLKTAPKHSGGPRALTLKTTSRSAWNKRKSARKAYKRKPTNTTSEFVSTASKRLNRGHPSTTRNSLVGPGEWDD